MDVLRVIRTRPNFIKVFQFKSIVRKKYPNIKLKIVHTGQHYDEKTAKIFLSKNTLENKLENIQGSFVNPKIEMKKK
jgi:UDP-N-acetylglucosamine 2-epimerase (non-hydrolysing)